MALQWRLGGGSGLGCEALWKTRLPWRKSTGEREILRELGLLNGREGKCGVRGEEGELRAGGTRRARGWGHLPPAAPRLSTICWL